MDVEHGGDPDEEPPPLPVAHADELAHVLLDAPHRNVLGLEKQKQNNNSKIARNCIGENEGDSFENESNHDCFDARLFALFADSADS